MRKRILITGGSGQLGAYLLRQVSRDRTYEVTAWSGQTQTTLFDVELQPVDLGCAAAVESAFRAARPDVILHAAAVSRVDVCFERPEMAEQINVVATRQLAELAGDYQARLVYVSTDLVFDGTAAPYREVDPATPVSRYGRSKLGGEAAALEAGDAVVARVSLLFGPSQNGRPSFFDHQCRALREGRPLTLFTDEWRTPLSLITAARALVALANSQVTGHIHLGGPQRMSRWEMGQRLAASLGCDPARLVAGRQRDAAFPEPRPSDVSLDSSRWRSLFPDQPWPDWDEALTEFLGAS